MFPEQFVHSSNAKYFAFAEALMILPHLAASLLMIW
jgi:hypothetical protein